MLSVASMASASVSPSPASASPLPHHVNSGVAHPPRSSSHSHNQNQNQKDQDNATITLTDNNGTASHSRKHSQTQDHVPSKIEQQVVNNWRNISHLSTRRRTKLNYRSLSSTKHDGESGSSGTRHHSNSNSSDQAMEPPVLSFYGTEPVPLPSRFAQIKRTLVAGHEAELEASWARLLDALKSEVEHIQSQGSSLTPSIDFTDIENPTKKADFSRDLRRYGVGVIRGVMPKSDCDVNVAETVKYLETKHDFKPPSAQDPTCFDFFWSPAQVRTRAHPMVLRAQKFAMSLWDNQAEDRMATRFPITYADRIRIHGAPSSSVSNGVESVPAFAHGSTTPGNPTSSTTSASTAAAAAAAAVELLGDFTSSTVIAQVDNGSLERWETDGYGRGGTYNKVFEGRWEEYDPWDPTGRIATTPDAYNGYGACSIFRMFQGVVALNTIEPGLIRLLPSPKLVAAYFLLRPFFSPKTKAPEHRDTEAWDAYLDASNWALDKEQTTIIHGAVPGHAQRLTELWHPHLDIRRTLVTIPTLQPGDYIMWHPDLAYHITSNENFTNASMAVSRAATPPPDALAGGAPANSTSQVSILVYVPAAPLTQTNALYLARQRKTFQRGHPGPDFDATGSGLGSEASHTGRPGETDIAEVGGAAGLQAMGLAPFDVAPTPPGEKKEKKSDGDGDIDMDGGSGSEEAGAPTNHAEAEVARLANIILFPDRYDFYMSAKRNGTSTPKEKDKAKDEKK